ncbi:MAG: small basic protein [Psychromonas sp.]|jgi:small basic protein
MFCYLGLPDSIAFKHNGAGRPIGFIDKQTFFYVSVAIIVGLNLLFGLIKSQIAKVSFERLLMVNPWSKHEEQLKLIISGWLDAIPAFVNSYLVFVLLGLQTVNNEVAKNLDRDYTWFLIAGAIMFMVVLFSVPLRILLSPPSES